jgi:peroxisomal 3,2-trans-enoyl-CoA isomerase
MSFDTIGEKKIGFLNMFTSGLEIVRSIVEHKKVFVLALNGPGVGAGGAWFQGIADLVLASKEAYLQIPFSALGLVPENGSAVAFAQHMGVHRSNEFFMFGKKLTADELQTYGLVNKVFPNEGFHNSVISFLEEQLQVNDGKSMMETKRLQNAPLRDQRMLAAYNAFDALAERFVEDAPAKRFAKKRMELEARSKARAKM